MTGDAAGVTPGQAEFIRESMRKSWGARVDAYIEEAAPNTAAHTRVLLELVPPTAGERVLDVATGPGVVALAAALAVGPEGAVVATDLAPEWEESISRQAAQLGVRQVSFKAMGAEALDLPDDSFDVAYCQFGLMFVPDPTLALREMRRVLRPGGRLGVVVWSTPDRAPCFSIFSRHIGPLMPPEPPERQLPTPLSLGTPGVIERHVQDAGFKDVRMEHRTVDFVSKDAGQMWRFRVENGPPAVRDAVAALAPAARERLRQAIYTDLEAYTRDGAVRLPSEAIYVTAVK